MCIIHQQFCKRILFTIIIIVMKLHAERLIVRIRFYRPARLQLRVCDQRKITII